MTRSGSVRSGLTEVTSKSVDRAFGLRVEADRREIRERLVVAQTRRAEELPHQILFRGVR